MADHRFSVIQLHNDRASLLVAPQMGGRLMRWSVDGQEVIHWPATADWSNAPRIRGGNPLLFPFLGRHSVDGQMGTWRDASGTVRAMPVHGFARELPFSYLTDGTGQEIEVTLADSAATHAAYPFSFRFSVRYRLVDTALDVDMSVTNTGTEPLPYYAGHHFYFSLPHDMRDESLLQLPPTELRSQLAGGAISEPAAGLPTYRLGDARIQDRFHVLGQDRTDDAPHATFVTPSLGRTVTLDLARPGSIPWYAVTTWTEKADSDFYCVEPWLGLPDAIHHGAGLRWVAPGAAETASVRLNVGFDGA